VAAQVTQIHIFPTHGEPGEDLDEVVVEVDGLAGDRHKKAAVQVVAAEDVRADTRANLIVSLPSAVLAQSAGAVLRVGAVELDVTGSPTSCPGVYAAVRHGGTVRIGDAVSLFLDST
jgi:uncharacterized protein YcbX